MRSLLTANQLKDELLPALWQALAPPTPSLVALPASSPMAAFAPAAVAEPRTSATARTPSSGSAGDNSTMTLAFQRSWATLGDTDIECYPTREMVLLLYYISERHALPARTTILQHFYRCALATPQLGNRAHLRAEAVP